MNEWLNTLTANRSIVIAGAMVLAGLALAIVLLRGLRQRRRPLDDRRPDLAIDVESLPDQGPPASGPRLEFYGTPVRLAVLVLAPSGRQAEAMDGEQLLAVLDDLLPGLAELQAAHQPLIRCWPAQLSAQGFTNTFFQNVRLPGNRGKGTPWCAIAGRFETEDRQLLAGIVCCANKANSLSQIAVEHTGQWMDILRAKEL